VFWNKNIRFIIFFVLFFFFWGGGGGGAPILCFKIKEHRDRLNKYLLFQFDTL